MMPIEMADNLVKDHWSDPKASVVELKKKVMQVCLDIIKERGVDWDDVRKSRHTHAFEARQHICAFAYQVLISRMSEGEISEWLGIKRTTFRYSRVVFFEKQSEQIPA